MPRITKVYTRTGDDGSTGLGEGSRVPKDSLRIEAFGSVDELNSTIGLAAALSPHKEVAAALATIQNDLFHLGADLCIPEDEKTKLPAPRIEPRHIEALESLMDRLSGMLSPLENFILPGGTPAAAQLHVARAVCRRAEREVLRLSRAEPVGPHVGTYLNRLSDALFVLARAENHHRNVSDVLWNSRA
jgi:cob(I)alamin adenosyltransferase